MWSNNVDVLQTFASNDAQNAWANISSLGWRRIKTGAADGVTNMFQMINAAKANARKVSVFVDSSNLITIAYLN
jgi:hypothetical protein